MFLIFYSQYSKEIESWCVYLVSCRPMSLIISGLPAHVFCYSLLACVLTLFAVPIFNYFLPGDVFILFVVIVNFVFIASPMCFTCLRSGLSSFASIKICFVLSNPFFLLLFGVGTLFYFIHLLYFSRFSPSCFTVSFTSFCAFQS